MKKAAFLTILALAAFGSQAWAQEYTDCTDEYEGYCNWNGTDCQKLKTKNGTTQTCEKQYEDCIGGSAFYSDAACTEYVDGLPPEAVSIGCCKWSSGTQCWDIMDFEGIEAIHTKATQDKANCQTGANTFWNTPCPTRGSGNCPTSTPTYPSSSSVAGGGGGSSSSDGGGSSSSGGGTGSGDNDHFCVYPAGQFCTSGHPSNHVCPPVGDMAGTVSSTCPPGFTGGTPILVLSHSAFSNSLNAMQNAVNIQATGEATVKVFDLKGNTVRSLKFSQGSYVMPLSDLPRGLYIVKASSASWKQTVKVTVR